MSRASKSFMTVLAAILLVGTLVGMVWARPNDRLQPADSTRKVTLSAANFIPTTDDWDFSNYGGRLLCESGECQFNGPVVFPCLQSVTVERFRLHVADDNASAYAEARLWRAKPSTGAEDYSAAVSSPSGTSGGLQTYSSPAVNKVVWPSQRAYIGLKIGGTGITVYGVTVEYHRN